MTSSWWVRPDLSVPEWYALVREQFPMLRQAAIETIRHKSMRTREQRREARVP